MFLANNKMSIHGEGDTEMEHGCVQLFSRLLQAYVLQQGVLGADRKWEEKC